MTTSSLYTAALSAALLLQFACHASASHTAFVSHHRHPVSHSSSLSTTAAINDIDTQGSSSTGGDPESILQARNRLLALSTTLAGNSPSGFTISRPSDKIKLQKAINDLEALASSNGGGGDREKEMLLGDWTLVATASLPSSDMRRRFDNNNNKYSNKKGEKKGWFKKKQKRSGLSLFGSNGKSLNPIQKSLSNSISVTQRIRNDGASDESNNGEINRVDNVVEFTPLNTLESIIPTESPLFNLLGNVNVNPLQVKQSKVVLVHKAEVESVAPVLRTKIALTSTILNVAGTSQFFDPEGADVFGVNNILGEFINVGTFDTPFVDGDVRISRTSGPVLEQLRVFVRQGSPVLDDDVMMDSLAAVMRIEEEKEVSSSSDETAGIGTQVKKVVEAADNVQKAVTFMAENAKSTIEKDMDGVNKALGDSMDDVVGKVQDAVEDDLEQIGKALEGIQSAIQGNNGGGEDGDSKNIGEAITNAAEAVAKVPQDVRSIVEKDATELGEKVEEALDTMVADVQDSVESDLKEVGKSIEGVRDAATGSDGEKEEDEVGEAVTNAAEPVAKVPQDEKSIVVEDAEELSEKMEEAVEEALDSMAANLQDSVESDIEGVQDAATGSDGEKEEDEVTKEE